MRRCSTRVERNKVLGYTNLLIKCRLTWKFEKYISISLFTFLTNDSVFVQCTVDVSFSFLWLLRPNPNWWRSHRITKNFLPKWSWIICHSINGIDTKGQFIFISNDTRGHVVFSHIENIVKICSLFKQEDLGALILSAIMLNSVSQPQLARTQRIQRKFMSET